MEDKKDFADRPPSHWVYILELVQEMYYVGSTKNVEQRYAKHVDGEGAEWTTTYPPIRLVKTIPCRSLGEALVIEDALTLWLMAKNYSSCVRGGRWLKEGHKHIYGLQETKRVIRDRSLSKNETKQALIDIVKWTIPDHSWYWDDLFKNYPKLKKNRIFKNLGETPDAVRKQWSLSK